MLHSILPTVHTNDSVEQTNALSHPPLQQSAPPSLQQIVTIKLWKTTIKAVSNVILILNDSIQMSGDAFIQAHVAPRQAALSSIDVRTNRLFKKMIRAVDEELDKTPTFSNSIAKFAEIANDQYLRKKFVEGMALPPVKELIVDLDNMEHSIVNHLIEEKPRASLWRKNRSLSICDFTIKIIALAIFTAISATATVLGMYSGALPIAVVANIPLGNILLGISGAFNTLFINRAVREGNLFGHFKKFFDFTLYFKPDVAERVCQDLKSAPFREVLKNYEISNLNRYGFITKEASEELLFFIAEMNCSDKQDREWCLDHSKEIRLYEKNPEDPQAEIVKERKKIAELKEENLQKKWTLLRETFIIPTLPEEEIQAFAKSLFSKAECLHSR